MWNIFQLLSTSVLYVFWSTGKVRWDELFQNLKIYLCEEDTKSGSSSHKNKFSPVHVCYNNPMGYSGPMNQCLGWNSAKPESATIITGPRPTTIIYILNAAAASIPERLEESLMKEQDPESGEMWTEAESQLLWGVLGKASRKKAETL